MTLEFVDAEDERLDINVLLYGAPKTGKTTGACTAPGPVLLLNADRPNASRFAKAHSDQEIREVKLNGLQTLIDVTNELSSNKDYASVVIDPVGELYNNILEGLSGRSVRPPINLRGDAGVHLERFCRMMCDLPVNTVFVAHEYRVEDAETGTLDRQPFVTSKSGSPVFAAKLMAMVDVIGYTGVIEKPEDAPAEYVAQLVPSEGRRAGGRFGSLGKVRAVDINEWAEVARKELATARKEQQ